jgi:hypothetical protein
MIRRPWKAYVALHFVRADGRADSVRGADLDDLRRFVRRYPIHWVTA